MTSYSVTANITVSMFIVLIITFFLGVSQFFNLFFITKYFEYINFAHHTLLILTGLQLVCIVSVLFYKYFAKQDFYLCIAACLGLFGLSQASLGLTIAIPIVSAGLLLVANQFLILKMFHLEKWPINKIYFFEMLGAVLGVLIYYGATPMIGFRGFIAINAIGLFLYLLSSQITFSKKIALALLLIGLVTLTQNPSPILNKRDRYDLLKNGQLLTTVWDPNGHVEILQNQADQTKQISLEGGILRSHLIDLKNNYSDLKNLYLDSRSEYVWGLDVVAVHFLSNIQNRRVALISCLGGQEIVAAKAFGASQIYSVDINKSGQEIASTGRFLSSGATNVFDGVEVVNDDGRAFLEKDKGLFDIIQIYSSTTGAYSSTLGTFFYPSTLFTVEALHVYKNKLNKNGILQISTMPLLKMINTFEKAFGENFFKETNQVIMFKQHGTIDELNTLLFKPDGWTQEEVDKLKVWLNKGQHKAWTFIYDPYASVKLNKEEVQKTWRSSFYDKPSTDNWPFFRLYAKPLTFHFEIQFLLAILVISFVIFILIISFQFKEIENLKILLWPYAAGFVFSLAQAIMIFLLQKQIGLPTLGITTTYVCILSLISISALMFSKKWPYAKMMTVAIVFFLGGIYWGHKAILMALMVSTFTQSLFYSGLIEYKRNHFKFIYLTNALGILTGFLSYNYFFIQFNFTTVLAILFVSLLVQTFFFMKVQRPA